jgi:hypothetical protein
VPSRILQLPPLFELHNCSRHLGRGPQNFVCGKASADIQGVCYAVGAAGVPTGIIIVAMKAHHSFGSVALVPVAGAKAVGALV